ncbi:MAG: thymidine kinase [Candidatus Aenigmarchaeota archaeon]|nr:thymidine kinase [Candidatus Aenigmarchaeota archaeon]
MDEFHMGHLEVICGPMFSGKSEELIRRLKRVNIAGNNFFVFKPVIDNRYDVGHVVSHDLRKLEAKPIGTDEASLKELEQFIDNAKPFVEVVAFDEANFFDLYIVDLVQKWVKQGRRVIAAGLDMTFRGEPFGPVPQLMAIADYVDKIKAVCMKCKKEPGIITQRLIDGKPAKYSTPTILVGGFESYEVRCRKCHEIIVD